MPKKTTNQQQPSIAKDDFIEFLAHATPEELNQRILEKGKQRKPYYPIYVFRDPNRTTMEEKK